MRRLWLHGAGAALVAIAILAFAQQDFSKVEIRTEKLSATNGDEIRVFHVANAHTGGDAIVHFAKSDVVHMRDTFLWDASTNCAPIATCSPPARYAYAKAPARVVRSSRGSPRTDGALRRGLGKPLPRHRLFRELLYDGKKR